MMIPRSLSLAALLAFSALTACSTASQDEASTSASAGVVVSDNLLDQTIMKGKLNVGETSKVAYEPELYKQSNINGVPYLAWELVAPAAPAQSGLKTQNGPFNSATITIGVAGNFPGEPDVVIVDENFVVLGTTKARTTALGEEAGKIVVDATEGPKFVLVRDTIWVAPMDFEISVGQ